LFICLSCHGFLHPVRIIPIIFSIPRSLAVFIDLSYGGEFPSYLYHIYPLFLFRMVISLTKQTKETTSWKISRI
ncbi:MAG: hypothetical protein K8R16_01275, partial [Anaerolineales bacterium]|nr:hypothetical protein [Anaerolineales bacterium]